MWQVLVRVHQSCPNQDRIGSSVNIGPKPCVKILKANGQRVHCLTYQHLTEEEQTSPDERKKQEEFDRRIQEKLGPASKASDFNEEIFDPRV